MSPQSDAVIVGAGPNGLSAAICLAQAGQQVIVLEAKSTIGGGASSAALTLPGFTHDICSTVHVMAAASPFFRTLPLDQHGLEYIEPPASLAHPLDDGTVVVLERSIESTAMRLGQDARAYRALMERVVSDWPKLETAVLGPPAIPRHPIALARFGRHALQSMASLSRAFEGAPARALLAGIAAHGMLPLDRRPSAGVALTLGALGHTHGWVFPRGGAQRLTDALAAYLRSLGGTVMTGHEVVSIDDLPPARATLCDLSPRPFLRIAGHRLGPVYRRQLERFRYGMAAFKVDWALDGPIPWRSAECTRAGTLHLGGSFEDIARNEQEVWAGRVPDRPFVLLVQSTLFDPTRAPAGQHTAWAYCHVPRGCTVDMLPKIETQIERFAPGFRDRVLARSVLPPLELEQHNPNLVGGDIGMGASTLAQLFMRPTWRTYSTSLRGLYLCSASTPPGVGVHGMCGYHAAQRAIGELKRRA